MGAIREIIIRQGEMSGKIIQPDVDGSWVAALMLGDGYVDWLPFSGSGGFTVNYQSLAWRRRWSHAARGWAQCTVGLQGSQNAGCHDVFRSS